MQRNGAAKLKPANEEKKGLSMKKMIVPAIVALAVSTGGAMAADLGAKMVTKAPPPAPSPWDIGFGGYVMNDYNFRGISQSNHGATGGAYFEPRYNVSKDLQLYVGIAGTGVDLPTKPSAEIDFYGGFRPTFGPLALDIGAIYYYYPRETQFDGVNNIYANGTTTLANTDFWEVYGKATYTFNDAFSVGGNIYYSPSWLNTGADGTYLSGTFKWVTPWTANGVGAYVSGEVGHYWLGTPNADGILFTTSTAADLPDYTTWNVGLAFTYKVFTLDLRYYDTTLSKEDCWTLTSDPTAGLGGTPTVSNPTGLRSNWCDAAFVAKLSFDMTLDSLK
jgi:uncharacterized protein (TIGR02001 family)